MRNAAIVFVILLVLFLGSRYCSTAPEQAGRALTGENIICFGDSLTYGTGAPAGQSYPARLAALTGKPVINAGVPGDTTGDGLARLEKDVLARSPRLVFITLGGNDLRRGLSRESAFSNLKTIVERIHGQGALVIIGGIRVPLFDRGFSKIYDRLAEETGAVLVPDILGNIMGNNKLMSDQIHPNGDGYAIMAERFHEAAKPYLLQGPSRI